MGVEVSSQGTATVNVMPVNGVSVDTESCENLGFDAYINQFNFFFMVISDSFFYEEVESHVEVQT